MRPAGVCVRSSRGYDLDDEKYAQWEDKPAIMAQTIELTRVD